MLWCQRVVLHGFAPQKHEMFGASSPDRSRHSHLIPSCLFKTFDSDSSSTPTVAEVHKPRIGREECNCWTLSKLIHFELTMTISVCLSIPIPTCPPCSLFANSSLCGFCVAPCQAANLYSGVRHWLLSEDQSCCSARLNLKILTSQLDLY